MNCYNPYAYLYGGSAPIGAYRSAAAMASYAARRSDPGNIFTYPQNLQGALALMLEAIAGEEEDREFYAWLVERAPTEEEKRIIRGIAEDELRHYGLFRQLYTEITGKEPPEVQGGTFTPPGSYCEGISRALLGEQNAVAKYRRILYAMQSRVHINMMTEIITDEIRHGSLYNYLYSKNNCGGGVRPREAVPQRTESVPQSREAVPQQAENVPQSREAVPQRTESVPQSREAAPQQAENVPQQREAAPQQTEVVPQRAENVPQQREVAPQQRDNTPQRSEAAPYRQQGAEGNSSGPAAKK